MESHRFWRHKALTQGARARGEDFQDFFTFCQEKRPGEVPWPFSDTTPLAERMSRPRPASGPRPGPAEWAAFVTQRQDTTSRLLKCSARAGPVAEAGAGRGAAKAWFSHGIGCGKNLAETRF